MSNVFRNGHTVDCVEFFTQGSHYEPGEVRDFLEDRNGTVDFAVAVSPDIRFCVGSCGPRPDIGLAKGESRGQNGELFELAKREARDESVREHRRTLANLIRKDSNRALIREKLLWKRQSREAARQREVERVADARRRLEQKAREIVQEELAAKALAGANERELAEFKAHRAIVESYIATMIFVRPPPSDCHCHGRGFVTFERFGHNFPWPCACIGGRDPLCVANWVRAREEAA